jgi:glycosyltransferase involved in cell wall biosynthesis
MRFSAPCGWLKSDRIGKGMRAAMTTARMESGTSEIRTPRVSVITIFLNAERFLAEAIESVLAQSFENLELILVDDGSTDSSTDIAKRYAGRDEFRIRYLEHPGHANRGMSASRNLGISSATGDFIAFIDADDVWKPKKLEEQLAILNAHPKVGMVCGTVNYWDSWQGGADKAIPTGHVRNRPVPNPEAMLALYPLGTAGAPCPSDILLRSDVVRSVGGFESHFTGPLQMYEDQGFLVKVYLTTPVYFSDRVWLDYRQHEESCVASVVRGGRYHEVRLYFLNWLEKYIAERRVGDPRVAAALRRALHCYRRPTRHRLLTLGKRITGRVRRIPLSVRRGLRHPKIEADR